ncbi:MAG: hypothetical protein Q8L99_04245, partial [Polycyclovorans sp.]|nr:hypothetical protein [Polycyclovorans sp.]
MRTIAALLSLSLLAACETTNVRQIQAPDGTAIKTVKCASDPAKCFVAATESCPSDGKYRVISSASRAGG